jgi:hypothetical protein
MKTLKFKYCILVAAIGMLSYSAMAQKGSMNTPQIVRTAFANQYPQANLKKWSMDKGQYVAIFRYNKRDWQAHYSAGGNWLSSERSIKHMGSLPYSLRSALKSSKYASYYVDNMARLQMPSGNTYRLRVDNNSGNKMAYENAGSVDNETLYFSEHGRLIKAVSNNE